MKQLKAIHDLFRFEDDLFRNGAKIFRNEECTGIRQNSWLCGSYVAYGISGRIREGLQQKITGYWRYFGVHSHDLGPIKKSSPRVVNLNIDEFNIVDLEIWPVHEHQNINNQPKYTNKAL